MLTYQELRPFELSVAWFLLAPERPTIMTAQTSRSMWWPVPIRRPPLGATMVTKRPYSRPFRGVRCCPYWRLTCGNERQ